MATPRSSASRHATKFFNTFEGGAVTTNDPELAATIAPMRNFGFTGYDQVDSLGINGKMSEISGAMGLTLLDELDDLIGMNHHRYSQYRRELDGVTGLQVVTYDERERNNYQHVVLEIDETVTGIDARQRGGRAAARRERAGPSLLFPGLPPDGAVPLLTRRGGCPAASDGPAGRSLVDVAQWRRGVSADDVARIADTIRFIVREGPAIAAKLAAS